MNTIKIEALIKDYKALIKKNGLDNERYKWELVKQNLGCPNLESSDFKAEIERLDLSNLAFMMAKSVMKQLTEEVPKEYRKCLAILYDETIPLNERIDKFDSNLKSIYQPIADNKHHSHHHDERTISILLTYYNPKKYTFYKGSYYAQYCKHLEIPHIKKKGQKYSHYLGLIKELAEHISKDKELIYLIESHLDENCYSDNNHLILAQDVLYQSFDSKPKDDNSNNSNTREFERLKINKTPLNQILYGPPGTGKTYNTVNKALKIVSPDFDLTQNREILKEEFDRLVCNGSIQFITFHQSFSYEDFVEGIKPKVVNRLNERDEELKDIIYEIEDGVFKRICKESKSLNNKGNVSPKVLIIDEINRGNIAAIFGELITLIEEDKREGGSEALSTILPYSKERFSVPSNIYIIGTMNTADRSIEALDLALRRRFNFIEIEPDTDLIDFDIESEEEEDINLKDLLTTINLRIEKLIDKDHKIGHAYFMKVETIDDLIEVFEIKIIPLLEEYFFGDYSKIGLILGGSFIERTEEDTDFRFADFDNDELIDLLDKPIYVLKDSKQWDFNSIQ